jgi:phosphatidate cytidylyltransferase
MENKLLTRIITGSILGVAFGSCYLFSSWLFIAALVTIFAFISVYELPQLFSNNLKLWFIFPIYPTLPICSLIYLILTYSKTNLFLPAYPIIISFIHDTMSYFTGILIGQHKITPKISPGKTIEGTIGGLLSVAVANFLLLKIGLSGPNIFMSHQSVVEILAQASLVTILALSGDLFVSALKRKAKVKDTGSLLPGHGGLLDRFDSTFFVATVAAAADIFSKFVG